MHCAVYLIRNQKHVHLSFAEFADYESTVNHFISEKLCFGEECETVWLSDCSDIIVICCYVIFFMHDSLIHSVLCFLLCK